jgi:hypothetical protein
MLEPAKFRPAHPAHPSREVFPERLEIGLDAGDKVVCLLLALRKMHYLDSTGTTC